MLILVSCCTVRADQLWLKNGGGLSGVVVEETPTHFQFKQGVGKMTLSRTAVEKIDYASAQENTARLEEWKALYFYSEEYAPADLANLAAGFRELKQVRESAMMAKRRGQIWLSKGRSAQSRIERLKRELVDTREDLGRVEPVAKARAAHRNELTREINSIVLKANQSTGNTRDNWIEQQMELRKEWHIASLAADRSSARHAALVTEINKIIREMNHAEEQIRQSEKEQSRVSAQMIPFVNAVGDMRSDLKRAGTDENRAGYPVFFERIEEEIVKMTGDLKTETVSFSKRGNLLLVDAVLNGKVTATFILDTGASSTTISKSMAARLGIPIDPEASVFSILADGSLAPSTPITLASVKVGTAERREVSASVLEEAPGPGVDGLLGMSFLKYFMIQLDIENDRVELIHLDEDR